MRVAHARMNHKSRSSGGPCSRTDVGVKNKATSLVLRVVRVSKGPYGRERPYGRLLAPQAPIVNGRLSGGAPNPCINRALPRINKHKFSIKSLHVISHASLNQQSTNKKRQEGEMAGMNLHRIASALVRFIGREIRRSARRHSAGVPRHWGPGNGRRDRRGRHGRHDHPGPAAAE